MLSYSTPFSGYSFSYDARNRLTESFVGAIGTSWLINGLGQRIAQVAAGTPQFFFVYDEAGHQTGKYDGLGNPLWETAWLGDLPVAVLEPAGRFTIAPDHLGSPHQITDASGAVVWLWHPDPFGNGDPTGAFTYDLRFPGQFFDQGTKLHYNYFRDYDPRTGRASAPQLLSLGGTTAMPDLTHLSAAGQAHMVDVSGKAATERVAIAEGRIVMRKATLDLALSGNAKKGDVFAAARIAAIMAAKKTHDLIPLCHPLALTKVSVDLEPDPALPGIRVRVAAKVLGQTGVEMEALTAVSIACLTIYDMLKAADRSMRIEAIALLRKSGGKSGDFSRDEAFRA